MVRGACACPWGRSSASEASPCSSPATRSAPGTSASRSSSCMSDLRDRGLRLTVGGIVLLLALLEGLALSETLRAQGRHRDRVTHATWQAVAAVRPRVQDRLSTEHGPSRTMADEALRETACQELEIFDADGVRLFSHPKPAPVKHWLAEEPRRHLREGETITFGPIFGSEPRLLSYIGLLLEGTPVVVRFARAVPELTEDLQERRDVVVGHAVSLALLAVLGMLAFLPRRGHQRDVPAPARALDAYEQAMGRLRDRGAALEQQIRDAAPFVRAGELTAGMAHEVRNGLGTIVGYAQLIERGVPQQEATSAAQAIREESEALGTVVRRFVDLVKQEELHLLRFDAHR